MKCPFCNKEFLTKQAIIRSTPQNKYYWGVVVELLSTDLGYSKFEIHEILKWKFLREPKYIKTTEGVQEIWIPKSTTKLTTKEFEKYMTEIRDWALIDLNIVLPLPNEETNDL